MALQISHEIDQTGVTADYWRVAEVRLDFTSAEPGAVVELQGYRDAAARQAGKHPLCTYAVGITGDLLQTGPFSVATFDGALCIDAVRRCTYQTLKRLPVEDGRPNFAAATDC